MKISLRRCKRFSLAGCALLAAVMFSSTRPARAASWQTAIWDDFNGNTLNSAYWTPYYPWGEGQVTNEQEYTSRDNVIVSNGTLKLQARNDYRAPGAPYSSGCVTTQGKVVGSAQGTDIQIRMRCPKGRGLWPSVWLHGVSSWPPEIDLLEVRGFDTNTWSTNYWWGSGNGSSDAKLYNVDTSQWHTYEVLWKPRYISWSVDGTVVRSESNTNVPTQDMYLIMNMAVGKANQWSGAPDSSTVFPANFEIDWIYMGVYK